MILPIRQRGDPILRLKAKRFLHLSDYPIRELAVNMLETMHAANGIGLAAPQVGESLQVIVVDISQCEDSTSLLTMDGEDCYPQKVMPLVLINPQITKVGGQVTRAEGCLSCPGIVGDIERFEFVTVLAETLDYPQVNLEAHGLLARVLQHEMDHLNGILFMDRIVKHPSSPNWLSVALNE